MKMAPVAHLFYGVRLDRKFTLDESDALETEDVEVFPIYADEETWVAAITTESYVAHHEVCHIHKGLRHTYNSIEMWDEILYKWAKEKGLKLGTIGWFLGAEK